MAGPRPKQFKSPPKPSGPKSTPSSAGIAKGTKQDSMLLKKMQQRDYKKP